MMDVQIAGRYELMTAPPDAQNKMITSQIAYHRLIGAYDEQLNPLSPTYELTFADWRRVLHNIDMGRQELAEAWDMVEGGWKHHKKNPTPGDPVEVLMELVDVLHFAINAYMHMGGQPDGAFVANHIQMTSGRVVKPVFELTDLWEVSKRVMEATVNDTKALYSHGEGAHGAPWEKNVAMWINATTHKFVRVGDDIRQAVAQTGKCPVQPGYVYQELMPWVMACFRAVPVVTSVDHVYSAFMHKNRINFERQANNY